MDKLFKIIVLVLMLSLGGCEWLEPVKDSEDKDAWSALFYLQMATVGQYCQGLGNPPRTLTVGVQSATINTYRQCFLVDTSGPVTVQVTTAGTVEASLIFYNPGLGGTTLDDPSLAIPTAQIGAQFTVTIGNGVTYTVLVN